MGTLISFGKTSIAKLFSSQNRRLVSSAFILQVSTAGLSYISLVALARLVDVHEFGEYTYLNSWIMIVSILGGFGLPQTIVQVLGRYLSEGNEAKAWGFIKFSYLWSVLLSVLLSFVMYLVCTKLGDWRDSWIVCAFLVPVFAITNIQVGIGRVLEKVITALMVTHIVRHFALIGAVFFSVYLGFSATANYMFLVVAVVSVVVLVVQAKLLLPSFSKYRGYVANSEDVRKWLRGSLPFLGLSAGVFLIEQVDLLLIGFFKGERDVALYSVASKVGFLVSFVYIAMVTALAPKVSRLYHSKNTDQLVALIEHSGRLMVMVSAALALIIVLSSRVILSFLGPEYLNAIPILYILTGAHFILSFVGLSDSLLSMTGNQHLAFYNYMFSVFTNILLNIVLVPQLGLVGAAWATLVSKLFFVIGARILSKYFIH